MACWLIICILVLTLNKNNYENKHAIAFISPENLSIVFIYSKSLAQTLTFYSYFKRNSNTL